MKASNPPFIEPMRADNVRSRVDVYDTRRRGGFVAAAILLSWLATSCAGQNWQNDQSEKVLAFAADAVILPCRIPTTDDLPTVEWSKEGLAPNLVFLYRDGCETFEMKNKAFQYRTNLIMGELKNGNISLRISDVQPADAGIYQCTVVQKSSRRVVKTLELVVFAASEPKLSVIPGATSTILQCEANCWFPEPEVTFVDDQGNSIDAENPKRNQNTSGCFTVRRRLIVHTALSRVTCRVHVPHMNKTKETALHFLPGGCMIYIIICGTVVLVILGVCFYFYQKNVGTKMCRRLSGRSPILRYTDVQQEDNNNENATAELQRRNGDLENQLRVKDEMIHQLTEELHQRQSTIDTSPSTSSPDKSISHPPQVPHDYSREPPASASGNHAKLRKHSKPGVPRQDPAMDRPAKQRSRCKSAPLPSTNNGANPAASFSSSTSEKKGLGHARSQSQPIQSVSHKNTISGLPLYMSSNRFGPLEKLNEESVDLLS